MAPKKKVTDEERKQMAEQMDRDLQAFIAEKIEANKDQPKKPFNFAEIEEELSNHPAFMTDWDPSKPMTPELEALIQLKYEECDSLYDKAVAYKEDGNHNFKISKYRWAMDNYTVAIQCRCPDRTINAVCYTNRAAAHFRLGNYRSSFRDVVFARKFVPDHMKAIVRGAQCCVKIRQFDMALRWMDEGLLLDPEHSELLKLKSECNELKKTHDRDVRKEAARERKAELKRKVLLSAIQKRNIKLKGVVNKDVDEEEDQGICEEWDSLFGRSSSGTASNARVFLDDYETLHWPVLLMYPEYSQTDLISQANETTRIVDLLYQVFGPETPPASWDDGHKYKMENISVYFEDKSDDSLYQIDPEMTIQALLSHPKYVVYGGLPTLLILLRESDFARDFLKKYSVK